MNVILILLFGVIKKPVFLSILPFLFLVNLNLVIFRLNRIFYKLKRLLLMRLRHLMNCLLIFVSGLTITLLICWHFLRMNLIERRPLNLDSFRNQVISVLLSMLPQLFSQYLEAKDKAKKETTVQK